MSESWRIKTIYDNRSQRVLPDPGAGIGATVVRSSRGIETPVRFSQGETQRILNLFGVPTTSNPELLEAIEYNKSYPIWLVSPTNGGVNGGVLVGENGAISLNAGISGTEEVNLNSVTLHRKLILGDGAEYYAEVSHLDNLIIDPNTSLPNLVISVDGVDQELTYLESSGNWEFSGDAIVSGLLDTVSGAISIEFASGSEPETGAFVEFTYDVDLSDYYFMLTTVGPSDDTYLAVEIKEVEITGAPAFEMKVYQKNTKGEFKEATFSPMTFSLDENHENGFGVNIFIENILLDSNYFVPHVNTDKTFGAFVDSVASVDLTGGTRGGAVTGTELAGAYDFFKEARKYPIDIFFDATANPDIPTKFSELRGSDAGVGGFQKYSRYILPVPNSSPETVLSEDYVSAYGVRSRGISYYWGWFKMRNLYHSSGRVISTPIGEVAKKHADIMLLGFGGIAPAWYDENGMGGQLTGGRIIEALYDPDETQLKAMDEMQINPVVFEAGVGTMIMSRRTSVSEISDWSFIDYSGAMDYIIKNIVRQVLPYQIVKMNDPSHRNIVRTKAESIIQPMTVPPVNVVDSFAVKCDSENNNDDVRAREQFVLDVAVKFTAKSREIIFTFINTPQGANVEEMFN